MADNINYDDDNNQVANMNGSDVNSANNFFHSLMGGEDKLDSAPVPAEWPLASLSNHTCKYLMAFDEGSNPAALETYLEEPNTNPELKKVVEL